MSGSVPCHEKCDKHEGRLVSYQTRIRCSRALASLDPDVDAKVDSPRGQAHAADDPAGDADATSSGIQSLDIENYNAVDRLCFKHWCRSHEVELTD